MRNVGKIILIVSILLVLASLASGLSITASTGANGVSSSTSVTYGATVEDYANEHIQLNPDEGTLSNAYSGSGNLPSASIGAKDTNGNYVYAYRSVFGKSGVTTWNYDWYAGRASSPTAGIGVEAWLKLTASKASSITGGSYSSNHEGDIAKANTYVSSSNLQASLTNYYTDATAFANAANAFQSLDSAIGSLVDVTSHAQNTRTATEYLSYSNGQTRYLYPKYGGADFEVQASALSNIKVAASATSSNVIITPTLPSSIKTAIMLEPFSYSFTYAGATDLGYTVFPDLVGKGYATLRYTDSGASYDKFQNLGSYNVALVDAHMNSGVIGLSTFNPNVNSNYIPASQLNYQTSKQSLVILAGCDSFDGYPNPSALANAVRGAALRGGFPSTVGTLWANDYVSYFFDSLSKGNKASDANIYANAKATARYGRNSYYVPLVFYGAGSYTL